jgi:uncharacterized SAM-binding protein YcdF (DUF218 family)
MFRGFVIRDGVDAAAPPSSHRRYRPFVRMRLAPGAWALSFAAAGLLASEYLHWQASRRYLPSAAGHCSTGTETVLVLGYPSRTPNLHPMQIWRTDIAVRSIDRQHGQLLFSGGTRTGPRCEAETMAEYAQDRHGLRPDQARLERRALTTWQNIAYSLPELEDARTIKIASSPMHAARARSYLLQQRPDLGLRLRKADDYRIGERPLWKLATVAYYLGLSIRTAVGHRKIE